MTDSNASMVRSYPEGVEPTDLEKAEMCERLSFPPEDPRHITVDKLLREYAAILRTGGVAQAVPNLGTVGVENLADWFYNEGHEFVVSDEEEVARALLDQFDITPRKSLSVSSTVFNTPHGESHD